MEEQTPYEQAPPPAITPETPAGLVPFIQQQANILTADVTFARPSPMHKIVVERVQLDPDPKGPDVYYHSQMKGLVISGAGLAKIANTAGIRWDDKETRRLDSRNDPDYCCYRARGGVKKPDGSYVWIPKEAEINLVVEREVATKSFSRNKSGDALKAAVDNYILQKRQFMSRICETLAKNRVIRSLLPIKPTYTPEELKRPFVTVRVVFEPDYADPAIKQIMMQAYVQAQFGVFGPAGQSSTIDIPALPAELLEEGIPELPAGQTVSAPPMIAEVEALAARKGYDLLALPKPLEQYSERALETFRAKLEALPGPANPPSSDMIPF